MLFLSHTRLLVQAISMEIARETRHPNDDVLLQRNTPECPRFTPACDKYSAALLGGCWCQCGKPDGKYTFFEPSNACVKVAVARQASGMGIICLQIVNMSLVFQFRSRNAFEKVRPWGNTL